jgi:chorismate mutase
MTQIEQLRKNISAVDAEIISLIAKRQSLVKQIGEHKKLLNLPVLDADREALLREFHDTVCAEYDISATMVATIFEILIEESRKVQYEQ